MGGFLLNNYHDYFCQSALNTLFNPNTVHSVSTNLSRFFREMLSNDIISRIKIEGMLPQWDYSYFIYTLIFRGYLIFTRLERFGIVPLFGTFEGYGLFHQPVTGLITNPALYRDVRVTFGKDAELVKLKPDYQGVFDIISYYADILAAQSQSLAVNTINSKNTHYFRAKNKTEAESYKKAEDQANQGNTADFVDKNLGREDAADILPTVMFNPRNNYIGSQILEDMRKTRQMFNIEIGIPTYIDTKKERAVAGEVEANVNESLGKITSWIRQLNIDFERVNKMFNLNLKASIQEVGNE